MVAARRNSSSWWILQVFHASFVWGFYNRVIPFLWSRLLGDIPRRENPFVKALKNIDEIINSQVTACFQINTFFPNQSILAFY